MNELWRGVLLFYFISHIPITIVLDLQGALGEYYPKPLQDLHRWYIDTYQDPLMAARPPWFKSFLMCEAVTQLPFFFVATYALLKRKNWIRVPFIIYGAHVATTVIPMLAEFAAAEQLSLQQRLTLISFYTPYLLLPLALCLHMAMVPTPFPKKEKPN